MSVSMQLGPMALAWVPCAAHSAAIAWVSSLMSPLDTV